MTRPRRPTRTAAGTTGGRWPAGSPCSPRWRSAWRSPSWRRRLHQVRMQLQSSLDDSLVNRAQNAARASRRGGKLNAGDPAYRLAITDVRTGTMRADGRRVIETCDLLDLDEHELAVATGDRSSAAHRPCRRHRLPGGGRPDQGRPGAALVVAQPLTPPTPGAREAQPAVLFVFGALILAALSPAGRWPATGCGPCAGSPRPPSTSPAPRSWRPIASRVTTRSPASRGVQPDARSLAASRDRQRRLVADAGHELRTPLTSLRTNLDLLPQADARHSRPTPGRAAHDVRAPDRGAQRAGRRPGRARPRRTTPGSSARWTADVVDAGRDAAYAVALRACPSTSTSTRGGSSATPTASSGRSPTCSTTPPSGARPRARSSCG